MGFSSLFVLVGSRRYHLNRSSYRGVRFKFHGEIKQAYLTLGRDLVLCFLTLGVYFPWFWVNLQKFLVGKSTFGTEPFGFNGSGKALFIIFAKGLVLSVLTLGVYSFWLIAELQNFRYRNSEFQGQPLQSDLTGGQVLKLFLYTLMVTIFTLGLGASWAKIKSAQVILGAIGLGSSLDFTHIQTEEDPTAKATANGLEDAVAVMMS